MKNNDFILAHLKANQEQLNLIMKSQNDLKTLIEESQEGEVDSSFVHKYDYFPLAQVLIMEFKSSALWAYKRVSQKDYNDFTHLCGVLESCGKAYNQMIKRNFESEKVNW